jgi:hypothetical protein
MLDWGLPQILSSILSGWWFIALFFLVSKEDHFT